MTPERWRRIEGLFERAVEFPAEQRDAFLSAECAGDEVLLSEVVKLLNHTSSAQTFSDMVANAAGGLWEGRRLGAYRVVRRIGSGGMGAVYLAVRDDDQYRKEVAIKVLRFDASDRATLNRFRNERQVLAGLEHPNISRLLDGGASHDGTPYIVMEYIAGVPITDYCEEKALSTNARVNLFRRVCEGVQYAHQRLVVHRDIKPANILVSSEGIPKLLDFGIAKLLDADSDAAHTQTGFQAMTPAYASPEQVRGEAVSTATDVYSLGAVLYEVLTGARAQVLKTTDAAELARVVCEQEVKPPSLTGNRRLRGDLDTIVLKAMQKDPARRYQSAGQFAEDLDRFLNGLPVLAQPDSVVYRARKYVRRHWLGVASAAAVAAALTVGIGVALSQARIAQQRFNDVRTLANRFLFEIHDSIAPLEGSTKPRELIVATALEYLAKLERDAHNDRGLERELARAYVKVGRVQGYPGGANLGRIADARRSLAKAVDIFERLHPRTPEEVEEALEPMDLFAGLESDQGQPDESLKWARRGLALAETIPLREMPPSLAKSYMALQFRMIDPLEDKGDSEASYQAALKVERALKEYASYDRSGKFDPRPVLFLEHLELAAKYSGRLQEALAAAAERLRKKGSTDAAKAFYGARVSEIYASVDYPSWDDYEKAIFWVRDGLRGAEKSLSKDPNDINAKYTLAVNNSRLGYYLRQSNPAEAVRSLEQTIGMFESMARQDPNNSEYPLRLARYRARMALARSYLRQREQVESLTAQVLGEKAIAGQALLHALNLCAPALANVGDRAEAARRLAQATAMGEDLLAREGGRMSAKVEATRAFEQQADFLRASGDLESARKLLARAREVWWNREPATLYVQLRRARADRLLEALRTAASTR